MLENIWREIEYHLDIFTYTRDAHSRVTTSRREVAGRSQTSPLTEVVAPFQST
jgi:hypothetical protein